MVTIFEDLIPDPLPPGVRVLYGTVTGSSPLRVQVDGDPGPLPITPVTTVACTVGDRVVILSHVRADDPHSRARAYVIVGVLGQGDTGWVAGTLDAGFTGNIWVRRLSGLLVEATAIITGTVATGAVELGDIPAGYRPDTSSGRSNPRLGGYFTGGYNAVGYVTSGGVVGVVNDSGASRSSVQLRGMWTIG